MNKKGSGAVRVEDRPVEIWMKVLSLVAMITLPLIGVIGNSLITGQERMNQQLGKLNAFLQQHEARISRNESDIERINEILFVKGD